MYKDTVKESLAVTVSEIEKGHIYKRITWKFIAVILQNIGKDTLILLYNFAFLNFKISLLLKPKGNWRYKFSIIFRDCGHTVLIYEHASTWYLQEEQGKYLSTLVILDKKVKILKGSIMKGKVLKKRPHFPCEQLNYLHSNFWLWQIWTQSILCITFFQYLTNLKITFKSSYIPEVKES